MMLNRLTYPAWIAAVLCVCQLWAVEPATENVEYFEKNVRPLLIQHCVACHGHEKQEGKLRLDSPEFLLSGGGSGELYAAGQPDSSLIVAAVKRADPTLAMPPDQKKALKDREIEVLVKWVRDGAALPLGTSVVTPDDPERMEQGKKHWAFQSPSRPELPQDADTSWSSNPIDQFISASLRRSGLSPREPVEAGLWLRRATLDITGLPPTPEEVERFSRDNSPDAKSRAIDRLLGSPKYGVRWGRHWLDVARYADSNGLDENVAHGNAWRYRDYVVNAWNSDKPYNEFVLQQVAGDLLAPNEKDPSCDQAGNAVSNPRHEQLIATGFLTLGPKVLAEVDKQKMEMDIVDEQVDTLGKAIMGLTLGCARCHDHKFDPISAEDYYGLAGIFKSTRTMESFKTVAKWYENSLASEAQQALLSEHESRVEALKKEVADVRTAEIAKLKKERATGDELPKDPEPLFPEAVRADLKAKRERLAELEKNAPEISSAMGVTDGIVADIPVHLRGSHLTLGRIVPRRVPMVLVDASTSNGAPNIDKHVSGREQLARWLVQPTHPLTARVIVNRLWRWHFGRGIVASTDNFGLLGDRPTHPELLDWLARELVDNGWSIKHIQRLILLSKTYGQASHFDRKSSEIDPQNRLLWRFSVLRLEAEALRDSILFVGGSLDLTKGQSLLHVKNREFLFNHTSIDQTKYDSHLRSIYLPVIRNHLYDVFSLFDYADAANVKGSRDATTIAPQALFMMNSRLVYDAAQALAKDLLDGGARPDIARIDELWLRLYSHPASESDKAAALSFVHGNDDGDLLARWTWLCQSALASNDFAFVR